MLLIIHYLNKYSCITVTISKQIEMDKLSLLLKTFLIFSYIFIYIVNPIATNPVITARMTSHMSACERSLHHNCIVQKGTYKLLVTECNEEHILDCLKEHLQKDICKIKDKATIPTIELLINTVKRRFRKNKKCANKVFMNSINDHFLVQGEGIEYTDPQKYEYSGSADYFDDNESGDDNSDGIDRSENDVSKTLNFWRENARKIQNGKQSNIQLLVFFDDPKQYKRNKQKEMSKYSEKLKKKWKKLQEEYMSWYRSSKYYAGS